MEQTRVQESNLKRMAGIVGDVGRGFADLMRTAYYELPIGPSGEEVERLAANYRSTTSYRVGTALGISTLVAGSVFLVTGFGEML